MESDIHSSNVYADSEEESTIDVVTVSPCDSHAHNIAQEDIAQLDDRNKITMESNSSSFSMDADSEDRDVATVSPFTKRPHDSDDEQLEPRKKARIDDGSPPGKSSLASDHPEPESNQQEQAQDQSPAYCYPSPSSPICADDLDYYILGRAYRPRTPRVEYPDFILPPMTTPQTPPYNRMEQEYLMDIDMPQHQIVEHLWVWPPDEQTPAPQEAAIQQRLPEPQAAPEANFNEPELYFRFGMNEVHEEEANNVSNEARL